MIHTKFSIVTTWPSLPNQVRMSVIILTAKKYEQDKKKALRSSAIDIFPKKEFTPIVQEKIKYSENQMAVDTLSCFK
jgi:DNA-binding response OmpR family regulator